MSMKKYVGKKMKILVDDKKCECILRDVQNFEIIIETNGKLLHIPHQHIGVYEVVGEEIKNIDYKINIFMCKNDVAGCKGIKFLSVSEEMSIDSIPCSCKTEYKCDFGKVGNLYDLPKEIQIAFLNGMMTNTKPQKVNVEKKGGHKNVK